MNTLKIAGIFLILASLSLAGHFASASELMNVSYTLNPQTVSVASDHTLSFKTPSAIGSGTITLYLRNVVSSMGSTTITFDDIDFSHGASLTNQTQYQLGASAGNGVWGVAINTSAKTIAFSYPSSNGTSIAAQEYVVIKIGTHTTSQATGTRQLVNSSNTATRTFSVVAQPTGGAAAHVGIGYAQGGSLSYGTSTVPEQTTTTTTNTGGTPSVGSVGGSTGSSGSTGTGSSGSGTSSGTGTSGSGTSGTTSTSGTTTGTSGTSGSTTNTTTTTGTQQAASATQTPLAPAELSVTATSKVANLSVDFTCTATGGTTPYTTYSWSFGDGTIGSGTSVAHTYKTSGSYSATCTVKDTAGKSANGSTPVTVSDALTASVSDTTVELASKLICAASGGTAPYTYAWEFGDGTSGTGASVEHIYTTAGLYTATCTVKDTSNKTAKNSKTIAVVEPLSIAAGLKLSADTSVKLTEAVEGYAVPLKGFEVYGVCTARGGVTPYSYTWTFGDGSSSSLSNVTHSYRDEGVRAVQCTISDARGKSVSKTGLAVTVKPGLRVKAEAIPAVNATTITVGSPASLGCTASGGVAGYGYKWSLVDETGKFVRNDAEFSAASTISYTFLQEGTYRASCTVRDGAGNEQANTIAVGVSPIELSKALDKPAAEVKSEIDTALNEGTVKAVANAEEARKVSAVAEQVSGQEVGQAAAVPSSSSSSATPPTQTSLPPPPPALLAGNGESGSSPIAMPPPGALEAVPNVEQQSVAMTISTSAPVTGTLCEQVGIKNADNATEMFVWYCPQEQQKSTSLLSRIKLAAQNLWYGLKKLALGSDQQMPVQSQARTPVKQIQTISIDINQALFTDLSSTIEKQLYQESKRLLTAKIKYASAQQLARLGGAISLVQKTGVQKIDAYSLSGELLGDPANVQDYTKAFIVKKSLAGRVIEVIVPEGFPVSKVLEVLLKNDTFFASDIQGRSTEQVGEIQKEFNKLARKAYDEGLILLRKKYAKEITLSADVDEALQKTVLQRLREDSVQKQLIALARSTVVQQVVATASASAARDEEPVVPGQQPTLSQLFRTPDSVTIAPLNQGQAEKLLKQNLVLPDFPGFKPLPNQIKEVNVLDKDGRGMTRLPSPMKLTMCWDDALLNALDISIDPIDPSKSMCIAHFNPSTGKASCEQSTFDMVSKCATANVSSVSIFALFGKTNGSAEAASTDKPRVDVTVTPSVRLRLVESLIDSDDLGIHQLEEAVSPSDLGGNIYIAPSTQLSLCISPNAFLKKVKDINVSINGKSHQLRYEQSRECFSGTLDVPNDKGSKKVQMRVVYIDDQVQTITLNTVVTNKLQAIVLNQIALPVNEVAKIVAAVNQQVKETVEVAQPALQTTAIATAPVVAVANPAVLTNTVNWYHYLNHLFSWLFSILGFRKRRKPWGVVYDAAAKHPVDLAVVRLFDAKSKKLVETQVTDKQGRFSFLTAAGTYSLSVAKPPYTFPSTIIKDRIDGEYANIYRQEDIIVSSQDQVMSISIPLDPPSREKVGGLSVLGQLNQFFKQHSSGSLIVGLVISAALAFYTPGMVNSILLGLNGAYVLFQFVVIGRTEKPWGIVFSTATLEPVPLAAISIINAKENKVLRTRLTDYYGRFNFLTPPGEYSVIVAKDEYQFPVPESAHVGKYHNLYHGGNVKIKKDKGYIKINIPLEPKTSASSPAPKASKQKSAAS